MKISASVRERTRGKGVWATPSYVCPSTLKTKLNLPFGHAAISRRRSFLNVWHIPSDAETPGYELPPRVAAVKMRRVRRSMDMDFAPFREGRSTVDRYSHSRCPASTRDCPWMFSRVANPSSSARLSRKAQVGRRASNSRSALLTHPRFSVYHDERENEALASYLRRRRPASKRLNKPWS